MPYSSLEAQRTYDRNRMRRNNGWKLIKKSLVGIKKRAFLLLIFENSIGQKIARLEEPQFEDILESIFGFASSLETSESERNA
jgi:hypothetical protein